MPHLLIRDHDHVAIVQHQPISVEPCRDNGVIFVPDIVPQDDTPASWSVGIGSGTLLDARGEIGRVSMSIVLVPFPKPAAAAN
jgi:hypothetical protein